ncbi:MAG TPA: 4Fe-4S binding protein [Candidatus Acidoferrales bacterium]|nr:4Fe-4S binding protein [Candidatus Acidoferrales bacterium]
MIKKKPFIAKTLKKAVNTMFKKPATEMYPKEKPCLQEDYRGKPIFDFSACINCGLCSRECPTKAIDMVLCGDKKLPQLNLGKCIFCYHCAEVCPKKAIVNSCEFELASTDKSELIMKPKPAGNPQVSKSSPNCKG